MTFLPFCASDWPFCPAFADEGPPVAAAAGAAGRAVSAARTSRALDADVDVLALSDNLASALDAAAASLDIPWRKLSRPLKVQERPRVGERRRGTAHRVVAAASRRPWKFRAGRTFARS